MKKTMISLVVGASLAIAPSVFALTSMSDANMKSATGQAGVSIAIDNVIIESWTGATTYTDNDGAYFGDGAGSVSISDRHTVKRYDAITDAVVYGELIDAAGLTSYGTDQFQFANALTIDVGTCNVLTTGINKNVAKMFDVYSDIATTLNAVVAGSLDEYADAEEMLTHFSGIGAANVQATINGVIGAATTAGMDDEAALLTDNNTFTFCSLLNQSVAASGDEQLVTGVVIGLPTLMITTSSDSYDITIANTNGAANSGNTLISISKEASAMAILGGTIEIAAH